QLRKVAGTGDDSVEQHAEGNKGQGALHHNSLRSKRQRARATAATESSKVTAMGASRAGGKGTPRPSAAAMLGSAQGVNRVSCGMRSTNRAPPSSEPSVTASSRPRS